MARYSVQEIFKPYYAKLPSFSPPSSPPPFPSPPLSPHPPPPPNPSSIPPSEPWSQLHNSTSSKIRIRANSYEHYTQPSAVTAPLLGQDSQSHHHHGSALDYNRTESGDWSSVDEKKTSPPTVSTSVVGIPVATSVVDSDTLLDTTSAERRRQHSYGLSHSAGNTGRRTSRDMGIGSLQIEQPVTNDSTPEGKHYWETKSGGRLDWKKYIKRTLELILVVWAIYNAIRYFLAYAVYASIKGQAMALAFGTISAISFAFFACAFILSLFSPQLMFHQVPRKHIQLARTAIYYIASLFLLTPAFANIVLVGVWKGKGDVDPQLAPSNRCGMEIDLVWSIAGHESSSCSSTKWGIWLALAILRLLITIFFLVAYFVVLRMYFRIRPNSVASSRTAFMSAVPAGRRRSKKHRYDRRPFPVLSKNRSTSSSNFGISKSTTPSSPQPFNRMSSSSATPTPFQAQSEANANLTPTIASPLAGAVLADANGTANSRFDRSTPQSLKLKAGYKSSDSSLASRTGSKKSLRGSSSAHQVVAVPSDSFLKIIDMGSTSDTVAMHRSVDFGTNEGYGGVVNMFKKMVDRIKGDSPVVSSVHSSSPVPSSNPGGASPNLGALGVASVHGGGSSVSVLNAEELAKLRRSENPVGYGSGYSHPDALGQRNSGDSVQTGDGSAADREEDGEGVLGEIRRTPTSYVDSAVSIRDNSIRHTSREGEVRDDDDDDDDEDRTESGDEAEGYHDNYELDELDSDEMDQFYLAHQHSERLRLAQEQQQYYHQQNPDFEDYTPPYIPPALGFDEFGRPYRPEEPIRFLSGIIRRMPTIESMGSREVGSISGSSLYQQGGVGLGASGGNGSNGHGYGPGGLSVAAGPGGGGTSVRSVNTNGSGERPSGSSYCASDSGSRRSSWKAAVPVGGAGGSRPNSAGYQGGSQSSGQVGIELVIPDRWEWDGSHSPASGISGMSGMSGMSTGPTSYSSYLSPSSTIANASPTTPMTLSTMPSMTSMRVTTLSSYHTASTSPLGFSPMTPISRPNSSSGMDHTAMPSIAVVPPPQQGAGAPPVLPPGLK